MATTLLNEEQVREVGVGWNAAQRAAEVKRRILAEINSGRFELSHVYLCETGESDKCVGCALGALAYSFGARNEDKRAHDDNINCSLGKYVAARGLASVDECLALEAGYEAFREYNPKRHPEFYAIGAEMRRLYDSPPPLSTPAERR